MRPDTHTTSHPAVQVVQDAAEFTRLRTEWNGLLAESRVASPFLTWDWLHAWWMHLREGRRLFILTARDAQGTLLGIAPLCAHRTGLAWPTRLEFMGMGWAGSDYLDLILRPGCESACARGFAAALRSRDLAVHLDHVSPDAPLASMLISQLTSHGWALHTTAAGICRYAALDGCTWDSYVGSRSPSHRTRCRRDLNALCKKFDVQFERVESESSREEALSALARFHEQRWEPRGGSTAFSTAALRAFHRDATRAALGDGWLRLYVLRLDGVPAAVAYCFARGSRFYLYQHGFDASFRKFSVGIVILSLTIRAALDEHATEFDMLYGDEPYKQFWASESRTLGRFQLFPANLAGRVHRHLRGTERAARTLVRRVFPRPSCA